MVVFDEFNFDFWCNSKKNTWNFYQQIRLFYYTLYGLKNIFTVFELNIGIKKC